MKNYENLAKITREMINFARELEKKYPNDITFRRFKGDSELKILEMRVIGGSQIATSRNGNDNT